MTLLKFAIINLTRNKKSNLTIAMLIIFGAGALIFSYGFMQMSFYGLGESMIHQSVGHFQIQDDREKNNKGDYALEFGISPKSYKNIKQKLEKYDKDIQVLMPKLEFSGILSGEEKSTIFIGQGVDSMAEATFSFVFLKIIDGKNLGLDFDNPIKDEAIIGYKLAKQLNLKIGDYATMMVSASDSSLNAIDVIISGTFSTGIEAIDGKMVMTSIKLSQELIKTDKITKLSVGLYDTKESKRVNDAMSKEMEGSNYTVYFWQELATFYRRVVGLYNSFFTFLGGIIILVVTSSVLGSVSNMVSQKTREFGMLKANGFSNKDIIFLVLLEVFILSAISVSIAFVGSHILMEAITNMGIMMPPPPGSNNSYPLAFNHIWIESIIICISLIIVALISSIKPSLDAGKLKIADALRA
jgi:putative ABC transport system permease protein